MKTWEQISKEKYIIIAALIVYSVTAIYSNGYYHPDEHYQIIEFAGLKLGFNAPSDLAWEYGRLMRPTVQPTLCILLFKALNFFGIFDSYFLAMALRLITAIVAVAIITRFIICTKSFINPGLWTIYLLLSYFLWFTPFISIRFSSETWSGLSFLFALCYILKEKKLTWDYCICGALFGLSFMFRFQSAVLIIGVVAWLILIGKEKFWNLFWIILGTCFAIQAGLAIDAWFYGKYTFSFLNYFKINILNDVASNFGVAPWYEVIEYIFFDALWPIGLLILGSILWLLRKAPNTLFLWCVIPFIFVHAIIAHKELRFLFPVVWFVPIIIVLAIQQLPFDSLRSLQQKVFFRIAYIILIILNVVALITMALKPAGIGSKQITRFIQVNYPYKPIHIYYMKTCNPFEPWNGLKENFYRNAKVKTSRIEDFKELASIRFSKDTTYLLSIKKYMAPVYKFQTDKGNVFPYKSVLKTQSIPNWIVRISKHYGGFFEGNILMLYEIK
ncbi:hypothetical protein [Arcticibacter tournemirensis]|uniref:Mannosyltransferase n=2 Tax=Pseudomonadati TaxID=3379134 RepID=A0A4Q0MEG7_9SPHI|nr:hypothetical protein [Arcticibacter tournemirensis]RXF71830.1 hypothetical protein EKH83_03855 [Arcticibacter tournemirensis]